MFARIGEFFRTFLLFELVKGMLLTGRHLFARKITVQFPEEKTPQSGRFRGLRGLGQGRACRHPEAHEHGERLHRYAKVAFHAGHAAVELVETLGRRRFLPLGLGLAGAVVGVALFAWCNPPPERVTDREIASVVAKVAASATPTPPVPVEV